ncbi:MAG: hypothetical protein AB8H86_12410 [Polyangiales bacterium]
MNSADKKTAQIVAGVVGCLGCAGLVLVVGVFGIGVFVSSSPSMTPVAPPMVPMAPVVPTQPPAFAPPPTPPDWSQYQHASVCPNNNNLRLSQFRAAYPGMYKVLPCEEQEPRPWSYVTFHLEDAEGHAQRQITLGFARGFPTQAMMESAAAQVVAQLGAPAPRLIDTSPFSARGASLLQRNASFTVPSARGVFQAGTYLIRQVVVPGQGLHPEGITVTVIHRVDTTEEVAIAESGVTLQHAVSSIQF